MNRAAFFSQVRTAFGALHQRQVDGFNAVLSAQEAIAGLPLTHAAYELATAWHETGFSMIPETEIGLRAYIDRRYDPVRAASATRRTRAQKMGNTQLGDGWRYRGRGYVQITWKLNYQILGDAIGVDLVADPEAALDPVNAYRILHVGLSQGLFTGHRLDAFLTADKTDYRNARRCVNGTDCARAIAGYAERFEAALRAAA